MLSTLTLLHEATRVRPGDVALLPIMGAGQGTRVPACGQAAVAPAQDSWITVEPVPASGTRFTAQGPPPRGPLV